MANTIDLSFVKQYDTDLFLAYQQMGSKFRDLVRVKTGVRGSTVDFQKYGKGTASSKTRNGDITPMNPDHTVKTATITDWYAGEYVDKFDQLKQNIDEKKAVLATGAAALGRKTDGLIITAANATTNIVDNSTSIFTMDGLLAGIEGALGSDVLDEQGMISVALGTKQWLKFLNLPELKNSDFGANGNLQKNVTAHRQFLGINFFHTNLLNKTGSGSTAVTDCLMFDKRALGWAEAEGISTDVTWQGTKASWFVNSMMSGGAVLIDEAGVAKIKFKDIT